VWADGYQDTIETFREASSSAALFDNAYGYAIFPNIGKGGLGIGAAYGKGKVFSNGKFTGDVSMSQLSIGFQMGGQAYSQIIFFEDNEPTMSLPPALLSSAFKRLRSLLH